MSNNNVVEVGIDTGRTQNLSEQELERLLAEKRLACEEGRIVELTSSETNTVMASVDGANAVGVTLEVKVSIEGVPVKALVDTGAQSIIIFHEVLHTVVKHMHKERRAPPVMKLPSVKLYEKSGKEGNRELLTKAEVSLMFSKDGHSVVVATFVQPDSDQDCLLGVNALPLLGISVVQSKGDTVLASHLEETDGIKIQLVEAVTLPSQKCRIVRAELSGDHAGICGDMLFQPFQEILQPLGLCVEESLIFRPEDGVFIWIPMEKYQGVAVRLDAGSCLGTVTPMDE